MKSMKKKKQIPLDLPAKRRDLERLITGFEKNIAKLATKEELNRLATKDELAQLEKIFRQEIRLTAQETKEEIGIQIQNANSRVLNVLDDFLKELDASRQERTVAAHQQIRDKKILEDHEKRIVVLEQKTAIVV